MKAKAFILLILIISSSLFYYGYFDIMLLHSKNAAMDNLSIAKHNHSLILLKVPASRQNAYRDNEIRIDGNLYDVGERKISNDTLYLFLYHDADEQSVLSAISEFFKTAETSLSSSPLHPSLKNVRVIYNPQYCFNISHLSLQAFCSKNKRFYKNSSLLFFIFCDIIIPPPRLC